MLRPKKKKNFRVHFFDPKKKKTFICIYAFTVQFYFIEKLKIKLEEANDIVVLLWMHSSVIAMDKKQEICSYIAYEEEKDSVNKIIASRTRLMMNWNSFYYIYKYIYIFCQKKNYI